jgi:hypothetical protein
MFFRIRRYRRWELYCWGFGWAYIFLALVLLWSGVEQTWGSALGMALVIYAVILPAFLLTRVRRK